MGAMLDQNLTTSTTDERLFLKNAASIGVDSPVVIANSVIARQRHAPVLTFALLHYARTAERAIKSDIAQETARGTGFLCVPIWLGLGAVAYFTANFEPSGIAIAVLISALTAMRLAVRQLTTLHLVTSVCLMIAIGAGCAKLQTWRNATPMLAGEIATEVTGRIVSINPSNKAHRAVLDIVETANPALKYAPDRVRVTLRKGAEKLLAGDMIKVRLRLMPSSGPVRPTSYDFAFQSYFDGIGASGFSIGPLTVLEMKTDSLAQQGLVQLEQLRQTIARRIRTVIGGNEGEVAVALIAGVQAGIDEATMESLRITGLAHILSISGLHMALVAGLFMVVMRVGFALFPVHAAHLPVKKYAAALALVASFFYLLLSGSDVAALRSFIMLAVFLLAVLLDQQALTMRNLALAAIAILLITPHEIMGPSFQMSFAATAALISSYAYWTQVKPKQPSAKSASIVFQVWSKAWRFLGALAMTSIIAGAATSIFSAWQFHRLAPMGLPANLAAMPVVSLIIMPSAVVGALAMPFGLEEWPLRLMGAGIKMMLAVSDLFAKNSPAGISGALSVMAFALAIGTLLVACILQTRLKWIALLPIPALLTLLWHPERPHMLISEDAKLIAVRLPNGTFAVNRERPNDFTIKAWQNALKVTSITVPGHAGKGTQSAFLCNNDTCTITYNDTVIAWVGYPKPARAQPTHQTLSVANLAVPDKPTNKVSAPTESGRRLGNAEPNSDVGTFTDRAATEAILAAKFKAASESQCGVADILILEGPTFPQTCHNARTHVITARDLALRGSAEIYFHNIIDRKHSFSNLPHEHTGVKSEKPKPLVNHENSTVIDQKFSIIYALGQSNRPWNYERRFSRAARNLAPFQPIPRAK
jgi:ComEC/Rec2-related protein